MSKPNGDVHCSEMQTRLQDTIQAQTFESLRRSAHAQKVAAKSVVWKDGMEQPEIGILCQGYLRFQRNGLDGRRQIVGLVVPGDIVGERVCRRSDMSLEAATDATIYWFDRKVYDALLRSDPLLRRKHYLNSMAQVDRLRWLTLMIGALRPNERVATLLLSGKFFMPWRAQSHDRGVLTLALNRRDIADMLATTPETICRTLKAFEKEGLIEMIDPVQVRVLDRAGLVARAALTEESAGLADIMQPDRAIETSAA
ncbi:Crp/Fnr family transcriptional regulator [uncultured Thioclava sp.]|uniref:Crp/Fnr family transcriptional regulator n=1 Tax=uncultured Thioclava sp. TaxID=473858 RepID=UPI0025E3D51A|nr:Crp/Fnr family transcriptional regulator [uncultured Thioclava sp.]